MLNPVAMSIIRNVFDDPRERAQAIGAWGAVFGLSMALGPVVGGALVDSVGWRAVFFVNVPIGVLAFVLTTLYVPRSRAAHPRRLDPVGQVLVIVALASLTYAIIEAPQRRLDLGRDARAVRLLAGLLRGAGLVRAAPARAADRDALLPQRSVLRGEHDRGVRLRRDQGGFLFLNTLYLQGVRHLSPFHAGLYMLPMAGMVLVFAPISGRLVARRGAAAVAGRCAGTAVMVASVMLTRLTPTTATGYLLGAYFLFGLGSGLVNPPITNTAVSGMPASQAGVASAIASTSRQVGMTLGVAVLGAISGGTISGAIGPSFAAATHAGLVDLRRPRRAILVLGRADHHRVGGEDRPRHRRALPRDRAASAGHRARRYGRPRAGARARALSCGFSPRRLIVAARDRDDALIARGAPSQESHSPGGGSRCHRSATRRSSWAEAGIPRPSTAPA